MSVPHYLSQMPQYMRIEGITNTADIVTPIYTLLEAAGWDNIGGTNDPVYRSPINTFGRYITVELNPDDGTNLQLTAIDDLIRTLPIPRLNVSGTVVFDIWCGAGYLFIQNTTNSEYIVVILLDTFPEDQDSHPNIQAITGSRSSDGTFLSNNLSNWSVYNVQTPAYESLSTVPVGVIDSTSTGTGTAAVGQTTIGTRKEWPIFMFGNDNPDWRLRGRIPNMLLFNIDAGATSGLKIPVVFDEADTRHFRVTVMTMYRGWLLGIRED